MSPIYINIVIEDELSQAVLEKILKESGKLFEVSARYITRGNGELKKKIGAFNLAAQQMPWIVLTDLDDQVCAPVLIQSWLKYAKHKNLLFRVAVHEVESWLMADRAAFANLIGVAENKIPYHPDGLLDPKRELIQWVNKSRNRKLREDVVPRKGYSTRIGPAYNSALINFVNEKWSARKACGNSPSLHRTLKAIEFFKPN